MLLFRKLVDETQMPITPEATSYHSSRKFLILLPLRAIFCLSNVGDMRVLPDSSQLILSLILPLIISVEFFGNLATLATKN